MLTAVPLPTKPLQLLWQSTVIDVEPGTRYGYSQDAAAINTTLAVRNDTGGDLTFPLILATTDPEERMDHVSIRVGGESPVLSASEPDEQWDQLERAITEAAVAQGHSPERIAAYVAELRRDVKRAYKSEAITLVPGQERFIRSYQRKLLSANDVGIFEFRGLFPLPQFLLATGGSISVTAVLPRAVGTFAVDLVDWTRDYSPQAFGKDPGLPQIAGRFAVSWFWRNDPELRFTYRY